MRVRKRAPRHRQKQLALRHAAINGINGKNGQDGKDGLTPYIGENGNFWIGDTDTGKPAYGIKGDKGDEGDPADTKVLKIACITFAAIALIAIIFAIAAFKKAADVDIVRFYRWK